MKVRKRGDCQRYKRCVFQRKSVGLDDAPGEPVTLDETQRYGKANSLEVEEVLFYLLDGLVDQDEGTTLAITESLLKFAQAQPEFTLKSILSFLEVQKTSISHQYSLLVVMRKCISQCKSVLSNAAIKEILLFMLKELNFIKTSDTRHMEMREIVNATSVLCPGFSVDVILAFIQDMRSNEKCTDIMCIYIQILTHLCAIVPKNTYVFKSLVSSCIISMYSEEVFKENNDELCKDLCAFLYTLSNMLGIQYKISLPEAGTNGHETHVSTIDVEDCAYRRFMCYNEIFKVFETDKFGVVERSSHPFGIVNTASCRNGDQNGIVWEGMSNCEDLKQYSSFISIYSEEVEEIPPERYVSIDCPEPISAIEPIFPLMVEKYLPIIYTNASYNVTCMEVFYSLVIFSQHITDDTLSKHAASLLDSMIVRFHNYLPNLQYRQVRIPGYKNQWIKLYKSASATFGSKIVTLFSSIGYSDRYAILPPTYFVKSLRFYVQILANRSPHTLYVQLFNVCGVLFGLLHSLFECGSEYFMETGGEKLSTHETFSSVNNSFLNTNDKKECKIFMHHIKETYGLLFSNQSTSLVLLEFLCKKLKSESKSEVTVSLYIFCILYSSFLHYHPSAVGDACSKVWRLIYELDELLKHLKGDPISSRLVLLLTSHLSRGNWLTFHSLGALNLASRAARILSVHGTGTMVNIGVSRQVQHLLNYAFTLKVNYDVEKRINQSRAEDAGFLRIVYEGVPKIADEHLHVAVDTCFDSFLPRYSAEVLLVHLVKVLIKNKKRNVLTIFRSVLGILNQNDPRRIYLVLSTEWLLKLMTYALVYMHDPVCYADEALVGSKIANVLANLLINKSYYHNVHYGTLCRGMGSLCDKMDGVGARMYDAGERIGSPYSSISLYGGSYGRMGSNGVSPSHQFSDFGSPFSDDYSMDPSIDSIAENFAIISQFLSRILDENRASSAQHIKVIIKTLWPIVVAIKKRATIHSGYNTFYKSDHSPSPLHTAYHMMGILNILSVCARMSIRMTSDMINLLAGLPKQNVSNLLEYSLQFCENYEIYRLLSDVYEWSHLLNVSDDLAFTMGKLREVTFAGDRSRGVANLQGVTPDEKEDVQTLQQELQTLRGQCIGVLGTSTKTRKHVLLKVYYVLLMNVPKGGSSFTLFGKSTAILLSEKIRCISISALAHLYIYGLAGVEMSVVDTLHTQDVMLDSVYTRDIMGEIGKEIKGYIDAMSPQELGKISILYKEVFLKHFGVSADSKSGKETLSGNMNLECIIAPLIFLLNTEGEFCTIVLKAILDILSQESLGSQPDPSLRYLLFCTGRLLYFLSNPVLKEYSKTEYDVSSIEGYYMAIFNNKGSMDDTFLDYKFIHDVYERDSVSDASFLSFAILCALSRHHSGIKDSLYPFSTLYCLLSYADWYIIRFFPKALSLEEYPFTDVSKLLLYYIVNVLYSSQESFYSASCFTFPPRVDEYGETSWVRLSKILLVTLFVSPKMGDRNTRHRIIVALSILQSIRYVPTTLEDMPEDERAGWINVVLLLWAHILRLGSENLLKMQLMRCLEKILNLEILEYIRLESPRLHVLENCNVVGGIGKIDQLLPVSCLIPCMLACINFLESCSLLSDSFAKIIHKILQHRYDEIDSKHLESVLITIFKRFSHFFQSENVPTFLRLFLIDLAKADFDVLCNALFSKQQPCTRQFQLSIIKIVSSDLYLLESVLQFLTGVLLPSNGSTNCPIEFVMEFTLKIFLENFIVTKNGATFISALIIYINSLEQPFQGTLTILERVIAVLNSQDSEHAQMDVPVESIEGETSREWVLVENVKKKIVAKSTRIIGHNRVLKGAFLESILFVISETVLNTNVVAILTIFSELMRHGYLINHDEWIKNILDQVPVIDSVEHLYFKSIHYYLKHERKLPIHKAISPIYKAKKNRECILSVLSGAIGKFSTDYYVSRALCSAILLSLRGNMKVSELVHNVLLSKAVPQEPRTRYAYLQLHVAVLKWYMRNGSRPYGRVPPHVQRHMLTPLAVALASKGSDRIAPAANAYLLLAHSVMADFPSLFQHAKLQGDCLGIFLESIMVKRSSGWVAKYSRWRNELSCFCGCGNEQEKKRICLVISFYLLSFFSSALPCKGLEPEVPQEIHEEFKNIKKNELNQRSSTVLFGDSFSASARVDWPLGSDFYDIDEMYSLNLQTHPEKCTSTACSPSATLAKGGRKTLKECPRELLKILHIADYSLKGESLSRVNIPFKNDKMDITNIFLANNAAFFDICNIKPILKSVLFTSPRLYRFCLVQKYLFKLSNTETIFSGDCIELCASIINVCSVHLDKEIEELKLKMKNNWPNCFLEILRFNAIMHFEALAAATTKKFYNILEGDDLKHKRGVFKAMEVFAHMIPHE